MAYKDLREFMALLEGKGLLVRVKAEVDPEWEINGVTRKLQEVAGPGVPCDREAGGMRGGIEGGPESAVVGGHGATG